MSQSLSSVARFKTSSQRSLPSVLLELEEYLPAFQCPSIFVALELHQCRFQPEDIESLQRCLRLHQSRIFHISLSPRSSDESASAVSLDSETADIGDAGAFKLCRVLCECHGFSSTLQELHLVGNPYFSPFSAGNEMLFRAIAESKAKA